MLSSGIESIKMVTDSIILIFSPITFAWFGKLLIVSLKWAIYANAESNTLESDINKLKEELNSQKKINR